MRIPYRELIKMTEMLSWKQEDKIQFIEKMRKLYDFQDFMLEKYGLSKEATELYLQLESSYVMREMGDTGSVADIFKGINLEEMSNEDIANHFITYGFGVVAEKCGYEDIEGFKEGLAENFRVFGSPFATKQQETDGSNTFNDTGIQGEGL